MYHFKPRFRLVSISLRAEEHGEPKLLHPKHCCNLDLATFLGIPSFITKISLLLRSRSAVQDESVPTSDWREIHPGAACSASWLSVYMSVCVFFQYPYKVAVISCFFSTFPSVQCLRRTRQSPDCDMHSFGRRSLLSSWGRCREDAPVRRDPPFLLLFPERLHLLRDAGSECGKISSPFLVRSALL